MEWCTGLDEERWQEALQEASPDEDACRCASFVLQIAAQCNEVFVGGNDTPWLLQLLSAPSDDGREADVIASLLEPESEGTRLCCTQRGGQAARLLATFVARHEDAPALLQRRDGSFAYVLCGAKGEAWSKGPVTLAHLRSLWRLRDREHVAFYLPAEGGADDEAASAAAASRFPDRPPAILAAES
jgi:hypothetical protein